MMQVRNTWTAWVTAVMVSSPPMERAAVCGLAAYAALNKPSVSPLHYGQQVFKQFVSTARVYIKELHAQ